MFIVSNRITSQIGRIILQDDRYAAGYGNSIVSGLQQRKVRHIGIKKFIKAVLLNKACLLYTSRCV